MMMNWFEIGMLVEGFAIFMALVSLIEVLEKKKKREMEVG